MEPIVKITHDGPRNAAVQITGSGQLDWTTVIDLEALRPKPHRVKVDAVHFAISDKTEVRFAWHSKGVRVPFLPLAGRGKLDFAEVSGLVSLGEDATGHIEMEVLAWADDVIYSIILDLSKHIGEQNV